MEKKKDKKSDQKNDKTEEDNTKKKEVSPEEKAKSAKTAMLTYRINTLLSLPMLLSMVMSQNLY